MGLLKWLFGSEGAQLEKERREIRQKRRQEKYDEWERRMREDELEEEYDEIDGMEDADY